MYEFEKHEKLTEFIQEMANTGKAPREWTGFIETLNQALRINDVVGRSEQLLAYTEWLKKQGFLNATVSKLIVKKYVNK
jgi:hypothetical protein